MRNPLIALGTMLLASCAALGGNSKDMVYVVEASGGA